MVIYIIAAFSMAMLYFIFIRAMKDSWKLLVVKVGSHLFLGCESFGVDFTANYGFLFVHTGADHFGHPNCSVGSHLHL